MAHLLDPQPCQPDSEPSGSKTRQQQTGNRGEELVADHLAAQGWQILARQWRCRWGELDLVAQKGSTLAFVEVKTRSLNARWGDWDPIGLEAVGSAKQKRLIRAATLFLSQNPQLEHLNGRFDVALVQSVQRQSSGLKPDSHPEQWRLYRYIPAAFEPGH
jgi:putative endonuclease